MNWATKDLKMQNKIRIVALSWGLLWTCHRLPDGLLHSKDCNYRTWVPIQYSKHTYAPTLTWSTLMAFSKYTSTHTNYNTLFATMWADVCVEALYKYMAIWVFIKNTRNWSSCSHMEKSNNDPHRIQMGHYFGVCNGYIWWLYCTFVS